MIQTNEARPLGRASSLEKDRRLDATPRRVSRLTNEGGKFRTLAFKNLEKRVNLNILPPEWH
jgi:hypothetical protein